MTAFHAIPASKLREYYNLVNFIETGCNHGAGLEHAISSGFNARYSCDLLYKYVECCQHLGNVFHLSSTEFLKQKLPNIKGRSLFWLDAHFPFMYNAGADEYQTQHVFPLLEELKIIRDHKEDVQNDVILCDDIRVVKSHDNPRFITGEFDSEYVVEGNDLKAYIDVFKDTHNWAIQYVSEGVLVFYPKDKDLLNIWTADKGIHK